MSEEKTDVEKLTEAVQALQLSAQEQSDFLATLLAHQEDKKNEPQDPTDKKDEPGDQQKVVLVPVDRLNFAEGINGKARNIKTIMESPSRFLSDEEKEIRAFVDDAYITASLMRVSPRSLKMWQQLEESQSALKKAMDTATATEGAEWVPTTLSANLIEKYRLEARVPALFNEIEMPQDPFKLPTNLADVTFYLIPESTTSEPSKTPTTKLTTGDLTLTSKKLRARMIWSEELNENSIVAILPAVKNTIVKSAARAVEDVIINGDTTATHQDSDVTNSKDHRKSWKGLRKHAIANSYNIDLSTFDKDTTRSLLTKMAKYGITPSEVAWIGGVVTYNKMRGLAELLTVDKYGPNATILTGEAGKLYGSPVITSEKMREDLNASGVYDGVTKTYTGLLTVNRGAFIIGNRGAWRLTVDFDNDVDQYVLNVRFRKDFIYLYDPSSEAIVAYGYKIS